MNTKINDVQFSISTQDRTLYKASLFNGGFVELLDLMPHPSTGISPELAIVNAARTSYLGESKGEEQDKKLLVFLLKNKHTTPFEMVEFKFRIKAPLMVWWQMVRHRTANLNMQSGRYTKFNENDFYVPNGNEWRKQAFLNKQGSDGLLSEEIGGKLSIDLINHYERSYQLYEEVLNNGVAKEQARLFLPGFGVYYTGVWKMDSHNLMNFLKLRLSEDTQHETRMYAFEIFKVFQKNMPITAKYFDKQNTKI